MEKRKESKKEQEGQEGGEQPKCWKTFWMEVIVVIDDELEKKQQQQQKQREDNIRKLIIDRKKRWESPTKASVVKNEESVGLFIEETTWQSP